MDTPNFSSFQMSKIIREYGYPKSAIRRAIIAMRRRGVGWKDAHRAVLTVNGAAAHADYADELAFAETLNQLVSDLR